jgi:PAS domain S-box-containing protein
MPNKLKSLWNNFITSGYILNDPNDIGENQLLRRLKFLNAIILFVIPTAIWGIFIDSVFGDPSLVAIDVIVIALMLFIFFKLRKDFRTDFPSNIILGIIFVNAVWMHINIGSFPNYLYSEPFQFFALPTLAFFLKGNEKGKIWVFMISSFLLTSTILNEFYHFSPYSLFYNSLTTFGVFYLSVFMFFYENFSQKVQKLIENRNELLKKEKSKYESLITSIADGVVLLSKEGAVLLMNKAAQNMIGLSIIQAEGKIWHKDLAEILDESGASINYEQSEFNNFFKTKSIIKTSRYFYKNNNGLSFPVSITLSPIDSSNTSDEAILVFRDISLEKDLEKAKQTFLLSISNKLQNPLHLANEQILRLKDKKLGDLTNEQDNSVKEIDTHITKVMHIINSFLNVSLLEQGALKVNPGLVNIADLCTEVLQLYKNEIEKNGLTVNTNYTGNLSQVILDKKITETIFKNLISNAVKYSTPQGKIDINISLTSKLLTINITNTGDPIPDAEVVNIFDRPFKGENLGLYMTKLILNEIEGEIKIISNQPQAITFSIIIPNNRIIEKDGPYQLV